MDPLTSSAQRVRENFRQVWMRQWTLIKKFGLHLCTECITNLNKLEGSSLSDVTVLGGAGQGFIDDIKSVTMGEGE